MGACSCNQLTMLWGKNQFYAVVPTPVALTTRTNINSKYPSHVSAKKYSCAKSYFIWKIPFYLCLSSLSPVRLYFRHRVRAKHIKITLRMRHSSTHWPNEFLWVFLALLMCKIWWSKKQGLLVLVELQFFCVCTLLWALCSRVAMQHALGTL